MIKKSLLGENPTNPKAKGKADFHLSLPESSKSGDLLDIKIFPSEPPFKVPSKHPQKWKVTMIGIWSLFVDVIHLSHFQGGGSVLESPLHPQYSGALFLLAWLWEAQQATGHLPFFRC